MPQGRTSRSDIQTLVEMGVILGWDTDDVAWALEQTGDDVGGAGILLINITSNGESVDAWRSRSRSRVAPRQPPGGATGSSRRGAAMSTQVDGLGSLMTKIQPYAKAAVMAGIKGLLTSAFATLPGGEPIGERLSQVFDIVIKGNEDSNLESKLGEINRRLGVIEEFIGIRDAAPSATRSRAAMKNNKSKKKNKSKRKKRKTKGKSKK